MPSFIKWLRWTNKCQSIFIQYKCHIATGMETLSFDISLRVHFHANQTSTQAYIYAYYLRIVTENVLTGSVLLLLKNKSNKQ